MTNNQRVSLWIQIYISFHITVYLCKMHILVATISIHMFLTKYTMEMRIVHYINALEIITDGNLNLPRERSRWDQLRSFPLPPLYTICSEICSLSGNLLVIETCWNYPIQFVDLPLQNGDVLIKHMWLFTNMFTSKIAKMLQNVYAGRSGAALLALRFHPEQKGQS